MGTSMKAQPIVRFCALHCWSKTALKYDRSAFAMVFVADTIVGGSAMSVAVTVSTTLPASAVTVRKQCG